MNQSLGLSTHIEFTITDEDHLQNGVHRYSYNAIEIDSKNA